MSITIIKPGLFDTIQDLGRSGYACQGVNPGGVMDRFAARLANALTGNPEGEALLEIHFPGPQILFEKDALISLTGANFLPTINDEPIACWQPIFVKKNTVMQFTGKAWGARAYLAVHGGFCADAWLNSASTHTKAAMGGHKGRKLEKNDKLCFQELLAGIEQHIDQHTNYKTLPWRPRIHDVYQWQDEILFMQGHEWEQLIPAAQETIINEPFYLSGMSDRMGYQLQGSPLRAAGEEELISSAVNYGTMQLLPGGQLIVLMADHQTTGGYPKIGHVISAHFPKLAQLSAGDPIRFKRTTIEEAESLLLSHEKDVTIMRRACMDHLNQLI